MHSGTCHPHVHLLLSENVSGVSPEMTSQLTPQCNSTDCESIRAANIDRLH